MLCGGKNPNFSQKLKLYLNFSLKGDLRPKFHSSFLAVFLLILCRKNFQQSFRRFNYFSRNCEATQTFEFDVSDNIPANVQSILNLFVLGFFCIFLLILRRRNLLQNFVTFSIIFHDVMKLKKF